MDFNAKTVGGQLYFETTFNRTPTSDELAVMPSVNLSRGGIGMFRLDRLNQHNGGGAQWDDGKSIHTAGAFTNYRTRVYNDVSAAWKTFKANIAKAEAKAIEAAKPKVTSVNESFHFNGS